jgi:hypothetical protein
MSRAPGSAIHDACWRLQIRRAAAGFPEIEHIAADVSASIERSPAESAYVSGTRDEREDARGFGALAAEEERFGRLESAAAMWDVCGRAWLTLHSRGPEATSLASAAFDAAERCRRGERSQRCGAPFAVEILTGRPTWRFCRTGANSTATPLSAPPVADAGTPGGWFGYDPALTASPDYTLRLDGIGVTLWFDEYEPLALAAVCLPDPAVDAGIVSSIFEDSVWPLLAGIDPDDRSVVELSAWPIAAPLQALALLRADDLAGEQPTSHAWSASWPRLSEKKRQGLRTQIPTHFSPRRVSSLRSTTGSPAPNWATQSSARHAPAEISRLLDEATKAPGTPASTNALIQAARVFSGLLLHVGESDSHTASLSALATELAGQRVRLPMTVPCASAAPRCV